MKDKKTEALKLALEAMIYADACLKKQLTTKDKHQYAQDLLLEAGTAIRDALAESRSDEEQLAQQPTNCRHCGGAANVICAGQCKEQPAQQEQGDSNCQDDDGCPTEIAVLQRFWRGEPIPTEHYPAWFRPAQQQEPVAWVIFETHSLG